VPGGLYTADSEEVLRDLLVSQVITERAMGELLCIEIDGPVNPEIMGRVVSSLKDIPVRAGFVLNHPVDLLLSGDYTLWPKVLAKAQESGHIIAVRCPAVLLGFTINPYVPRFDPVRRSYSAHVLPAKPFIDAIRAEVCAPCTDIVSEGADVLEGWLTNPAASCPNQRAR